MSRLVKPCARRVAWAAYLVVLGGCVLPELANTTRDDARQSEASTTTGEASDSSGGAGASGRVGSASDDAAAGMTATVAAMSGVTGGATGSNAAQSGSSAMPEGNTCGDAGPCAQCTTDRDCRPPTSRCKVAVCLEHTCSTKRADDGTACSTASRPGTCTAGTCQCTPQCDKQCGADGCGGQCPNMCLALGQKCGANDVCIECQPNCSAKCKGADDGCNGKCDNDCSSPELCVSGVCVLPSTFKFNTPCSGTDSACTNADGMSRRALRRKELPPRRRARGRA
jgi:hypothetical protein